MSEDGEDRRSHATLMFAWEDQVARDPRMTRQALALRAVTIIRKKTGQRIAGVAEFEQRWLAVELGATIRGTQKALDCLVEVGHLRVHCGKSKGRPNLYEPIVFAGTERTAVRTPNDGDEPQFAPGTNASDEKVRTAVRTKSASSSNLSGEPRHAQIPRDWRAAKDEGRNALADFDERLRSKRANRAG